MRWALGFTVLAMVVLTTTPAEAGFPGQNGRIAFVGVQSGQADIYTMNPDGSDVRNLTNDSVSDTDPAWSPDGRKIAFSRGPHPGEIYVMNADGSGLAPLAHPQAGRAPAWSPDGTRIAFSNDDVYTADADGSNRVNLTPDNPLPDKDPAWSPDGSKIAFSQRLDDPGYSRLVGFLSTMNPDGTNKALVQHGYDGPFGSGCSLTWHDTPDWSPDGTTIGYHGIYDIDGDLCVSIESVRPDGTGRILATFLPSVQIEHHVNGPAWAPDGTKISYGARVDFQQRIVIADPDGSDAVVVGPSSVTALDPDWQPLPAAGYPRPTRATPVYMALVPAFLPCAAANREHGPPLAFGSCSPPTPSSTYLTVGTPDANGQPAKFTAYARFAVRKGDPSTPLDEADVVLEAKVTDVRLASDLTDYTGELPALPRITVTDKLNTPHPGGTGPGTVTEFAFPFAIPCTATADATAGATCAVNTSADALVPGAVPEGRRSIWELERFEVGDGGPQASPVNRPFLVPGIFVP